MITIICSTQKAAKEVRALFARYGVLMDRVEDREVFPAESGEPNIHLILNYTHDKEAQIRSEISKIAGAILP